MSICEMTVHTMAGMFDFILNQKSWMDLLRIDETFYERNRSWQVYTTEF
jgi:hypothetical protein